MSAYLVRRVAQGIFVLWLVSVVTFGLEHALPGGPARAILGHDATPSNIAVFNRQNGLDQPVPVQYVTWLGRTLRGDLGFSYQQNQPVAQLITERLPKSALLTGLAMVIALLIAIPVGFLQAIRRNTIIDYLLTGAAFVFYSMPVFWLALVLVNVLAIDLHLFPPQAPQGSFTQILSDPRGLVLPVGTLALVILAAFSRYTRSSVLDNLTFDYVRTARAKGVSTPRLLHRHILRNALAPVVTLLGFFLPAIVAGAIVIESIFNYPGMGLLFYNAATSQDYPVLIAVTLVVGAAVVLGSLAADIGYALLDPRVRYTRS